MSNYFIKEVKARQIIDSRGNPTVEADVILNDGSLGRAAVPSGASTGTREALELRDGGSSWMGKGVKKAVSNINDIVVKEIISQDASKQADIDRLLIDLDGTEDKSNLGANAILAVSLACAKAVANSRKWPLYRYISEMTGSEMSLPMPMMNVMNGGAHASGSSDVQEYMIVPIGAINFPEVMQIGTEIFHNLGKILKDKGYATTVGDEGGYAPKLKHGNFEPLELISEAVKKAGYELGKEVAFALDVAASELYDEENYNLKTEGKTIGADAVIRMYTDWVDDLPIVSIEDGLAEGDWENWTKLTKVLGREVQLVGDDLLVTNPKLLQEAIDKKACNAILIKPNQIGTLTETITAVKLAKTNGFNTVMSHRSGETEDTTIAHLAVGLGTNQIKTGSLSRTDRICKYNELLRIAEENPNIKLAKPF